MKATGGKRGKLPYFFQFSKNGRRSDNAPATYAKPNNSTMNRICAAFDNVGRLDFRMADVPPFDWRMLLNENDVGFNPAVVEAFIFAVQEGASCRISASQTLDLKEKSKLLRSNLMAENIISRIEAIEPLESAYKSLVRYLFVDDNGPKVSLKQEFWKVFGSIAYERISNNLKNCVVCPRCRTKYPAWASDHVCPRKTLDVIECASCGKLVPKTNNRQCRCPECQTEYRKLKVAQNVKMYRHKQKAS